MLLRGGERDVDASEFNYRMRQSSIMNASLIHACASLGVPGKGVPQIMNASLIS